MKKFLLVIPAGILFHVATAQIPKNSLLLGGGVGVNTSKIEDANSNELKQRSVSINVSAGVAVRENTIVGGILNFGQQVQKNDYPNQPFARNESKTYGGGAFLRQYLPLGKNFYLFGQGVASYSHSQGEQLQSGSGTVQTNGWSVGLSVAPGISYAVNRRFHLEAALNDIASIGYGQSTTRNTFPGGSGETKQSSFGLSTSLGSTTPLSIGFRFLFTGKPKG